MPCHHVTLQPSGRRFAVRAGQTLLLAALEAGLALPSSCRAGTCRTCMLQKTAGQVSWRVEWPGLTPEEKAQGWILPCVAEPASDLVLQEATQRPWWET